MATNEVTAEREIAVPAEIAYRCIADYAEHHHRFLPPAFSDYAVEQGGLGAGTIVRFRVTAGGRTRAMRVEVSEPEPGRVLAERDLLTGAVTTFTVTPLDGHCRVRFTTTWQGAGGLGGLIERLAAPLLLRRLYADELERLDEYARQLAVSG